MNEVIMDDTAKPITESQVLVCGDGTIVDDKIAVCTAGTVEICHGSKQLLETDDAPSPSSVKNGMLLVKVDDNQALTLNKFESNVNKKSKDYAHVENSKNADQVALHDVGNKFVSPPGLLPRKSLLKRAKSETSFTSDILNPPKRIRIVENLDIVSCKNHVQLNERSESPKNFEGADDLAVVNEVSSCGEILRWLKSPSCSIDQSSINVEFVRDNLSEVKRNFSVEIDMRFILTETCTAILGSKTSIAGVGASDFHIWVTRHSLHNNPNLKQIQYKENFLTLANIDAVLQYDLSSPEELTMTGTPTDENIYYIGDLWQKSKGFREYLLWKTSQTENQFSTKIFTMRTSGPFMTLAATNEKIGKIFPEAPSLPDEVDLSPLSTENVETYGSCSDYQNILDVNNINNFVGFVHSQTNGKGLHTLIVDNAEISYVYESCREIRLQKYFYCECLLALRCLREGGTFVCKIFDTFTLFTNGLLFLLYKCFKSIAIHKPSSSSTCTSARFIICKGKIENSDSKYVVDFLSDCLDMVVNNQEQRKIVRRRVRKRLAVVKMEVQRIVPLRIILSHAEFFQFVRESNIRLTTKLAESINKVCQLTECGDRTGLSDLTANLKKANQLLLASINIPISLYTDAQIIRLPVQQVEKFLIEHGLSTELFRRPVKKLNIGTEDIPKKNSLAFPALTTSIGNIFKCTYGWFYGFGESKILHLSNNLWTQLDYPEFLLPYGTLLWGEISETISYVDGKQKFTRCFHIFDGLFVRGSYIGLSPFETRQGILKRLVTTLKSSRFNMNYLITPSISLKHLQIFYLSTTTANVMGYNQFVRSFVREVGDNKTLQLVDSFLIIDATQELSPINFLNRSEQYILNWEGDEQTTKSYLEKLESILG